MPTYCYICDACGFKVERVKAMSDQIDREHCRCGSGMRRDYGREVPGVVADPEACQADIDRNIDQRRRNIEVDRPVLARTLARVPGIPKIRGRDGRQYAFFRNNQDRARTLKRLGLPHDE